MKIIEIKPLLKPVQTSVSIPGSKSYTNRALLLAAMTGSKVKIVNPLTSDDTKAMIDCLKTLGIKVLEKKGSIEISGNLEDIPNRLYNLDANLSGTTLRFLLALATIIPGTKKLFGKEGLNKRPIGELVSGLTQLGAKIDYLGVRGFPPVLVKPSSLHPGIVKLKGDISSQYISAILMIAPLVGKVTVQVIGEQISKPYIDMTTDTIKQFGVEITNEGYKRYIVSHKQQYKATQYTVEGDYSSASYFLAIAALTNSNITLENINPKSKQADIKFVEILETMGNRISFDQNQLTIQGKEIKPVNVDMRDCPDQIQTLAVLAAFAKGITKISGVSSLRIKETDRIFALREELKKMGIRTSSTKDTLTIYGGNPKAAIIKTYNDHRMAMSFAMAGVKLSGMKIVDPDVVNKTFPSFWEKLKALGVGITEEKKPSERIVLIGFMGAGKSSVAPVLAKKLNLLHIEMDELALKKSKQKTINDIFENQGESTFRSLERQVAKSLKLKSNIIISAGGGVVMNQKTMKYLSENALVILLDTSFETIKKRLAQTSGKPLWNNQKKAETLYKLRIPLYKKCADVVVTTDSKSIDEVVEEIILKIGGKL